MCIYLSTAADVAAAAGGQLLSVLSVAQCPATTSAAHLIHRGKKVCSASWPVHLHGVHLAAAAAASAATAIAEQPASMAPAAFTTPWCTEAHGAAQHVSCPCLHPVSLCCVLLSWTPVSNTACCQGAICLCRSNPPHVYGDVCMFMTLFLARSNDAKNTWQSQHCIRRLTCYNNAVHLWQ